MLTKQEANKLLSYDIETGIFTWNISKGCCKKGNAAGRKHHTGYICITVNKIEYLAHRLVFLYLYGKVPEYVDHINRIRTDNRLSNLRPSTPLLNALNRGLQQSNKSGFAGIDWYKAYKKWRASITIHGNYISLGYFTDKADAIRARKAAEDFYFKKYLT